MSISSQQNQQEQIRDHEAKNARAEREAVIAFSLSCVVFVGIIIIIVLLLGLLGYITLTEGIK